VSEKKADYRQTTVRVFRVDEECSRTNETTFERDESRNIQNLGYGGFLSTAMLGILIFLSRTPETSGQHQGLRSSRRRYVLELLDTMFKLDSGPGYVRHIRPPTHASHLVPAFSYKHGRRRCCLL
jgi:hypothetical protein